LAKDSLKLSHILRNVQMVRAEVFARTATTDFQIIRASRSSLREERYRNDSHRNTTSTTQPDDRADGLLLLRPYAEIRNWPNQWYRQRNQSPERNYRLLPFAPDRTSVVDFVLLLYVLHKSVI